MRYIHDTHKTVERILEAYPSTRNSDAVLYVQLCQITNERACRMPFEEVMLNRKAYGLPNFESVGRARRKIQAEKPWLRADKEVEDERYENWKLAREYATE